MKHILILLIIYVGAFGQTTVPSRQVSIEHNGKVIKVILAVEVADRRDSNAATPDDLRAISEAVEIALGHVPFRTSNPCDKPLSRLINDGRPVANCSASQEKIK